MSRYFEGWLNSEAIRAGEFHIGLVGVNASYWGGTSSNCPPRNDLGCWYSERGRGWRRLDDVVVAPFYVLVIGRSAESLVTILTSIESDAANTGIETVSELLTAATRPQTVPLTCEAYDPGGEERSRQYALHRDAQSGEYACVRSDLVRLSCSFGGGFVAKADVDALRGTTSGGFAMAPSSGGEQVEVDIDCGILRSQEPMPDLVLGFEGDMIGAVAPPWSEWSIETDDVLEFPGKTLQLQYFIEEVRVLPDGYRAELPPILRGRRTVMDPIWVLIVVALVLGNYWLRSNGLRRRSGSELQDLLPQFTTDIMTRAGRGLDPDWVRYSEESDRQHEDTCERIRNYATTALATGIGGTMLMLMLHLSTDAESTDAVAVLLQEMGMALVASLLGVVCNLVILLFILPGASDRFHEERQRVNTALLRISEANQPRTPATNLNDAISEKLEKFLENTADNFPGVITGFRESVARLDGVASDFKSSGEQIQSSTEALSSSMSGLDAFPTHLGRELTHARQEWTSGLRERQAQYVEAFGGVLDEQTKIIRETLAELRQWQLDRGEAESKWREERSAEEKRHRSALAELLNKATAEQGAAVGRAVATLEEWQAKRTEADERWLEMQASDRATHSRFLRQVENATGDVARTVEHLPQAFSDKIVVASDTLGRRFGLEARQQVEDVTVAMQTGNQKLRDHLEGHVRQLVNKMGDIVQQGLKPTKEEIARIGRNLEAAGADLRMSIKDFADHGQGFRASLEDAAKEIEASTRQLAGVHDSTRASITEIQEGYRVIHSILDESIKKTESLLREVSAVQRSRKRSFLARIFSRSPKPEPGRRAL